MNLDSGSINTDIENLDLSIWNYGNYIVTAPIDCMDEGNADIEEDEPKKVNWKTIKHLIEEK